MRHGVDYVQQPGAGNLALRGRLESYDFVASLHRNYHGKPARPEKVRQVNAAFAQGRMYFEGGANAELGVRPLLLYYGAMSLAAGLVVFKEKRTGRLKSSHGLKPGNWTETLKQGPGRVLDLSISAAVGGTFPGLCRAIWHWHAIKVWRGDRLDPQLMDLGCIRFAKGISSVTLGGLLARSRYTGGGYGEVAGAPHRLHRGRVSLDGGEFVFYPAGHLGNQGGLHELSERFGGRLRFPWGDPDIPVFHCIEHGAGDREMCFVEPFANGDRLSEFVKLYLIAYVLGMVARYFPTVWMGLLRNEPEGGAQPLLARATGVIQTELVREFAQQIAVLVDDPHFFGAESGSLSSNGPLALAWQNSRGSQRDSRRYLGDRG